MPALDCGHEPSPHSDFTTGTAHTPDGREICWTCADSEQAHELETADAFTGYLSCDGRNITTWSGGVLARVIDLNTTAGYTPSGGRFERVSTWVTTADGARWYGRGPGRGMYHTIRRSRAQEG